MFSSSPPPTSRWYKIWSGSGAQLKLRHVTFCLLRYSDAYLCIVHGMPLYGLFNYDVILELRQVFRLLILHPHIHTRT